MRWLFTILLLAGSVFAQSQYGADYILLRSVNTDPNSNLTFGVLPKPGFAPASSPLGAVTMYFDTTAACIKASINGAAYTCLGSGGTSGPAQNTWQIQTTSCGGNPNCTQIFGDGQVVFDAVTNSTTTITSATANFTQADVGKSVWAVQRSANYPFTTGTLICGNSTPVPTITTVNSSTSITISGSNCTSSQSSVILTWGHKDGATLHAMTPGCATIYAPANLNIIVDDTFLTTVPTCASSSGITGATGVPQPSLYVNGTSTNWIISPDFTWSHCTGTGAVSGGVCIGSGLGQIWNLVLWGTGASNASTTNCANSNGKVMLAHNSTAGALYFTNVAGICPGSTLTGAELNALDDQWNEGGVQNVGSTALVISNKGVNTQSLDNLELGVPGTNAIGLKVNSGAQLNDYGTFLTACASISGTMTSRNSHFVNGGGAGFPCIAAVTVNSGGLWFSDGDFINQDAAAGQTFSVGLAPQSGGTATIRNTKIGASAGSQVAISNAGTVISHGGNTITSGAVQATLLNIGGFDVLSGSCSGVATATSTLGLLVLGQQTAATCTSTTVTVGPVMTRAGTIFDLSVTATAAGTNASSGVVTVLKNGSATTSTCTIGTGTSCQDFTHTVTYVAGDVITVQFTTQAADTLAGVKANVVAW